MAEMKFDMSGGAAVIEALAAIARLRLPVRLIAVVGATENLPSGRAIKPGDIVTAANGKTIEVNNTDAEGRLVLADCLCHAVAEGAEQIVDLATLTGAVIVALGSTYAGLMSNDDAFAARIAAAGERTGEIVWRLPLHEEYDELIKGTYADLDNAPEARKAGTIVGGAFLSNFVGDVAVGAPRHRRLGLGPRPRLRRQGRLGLRRAPAGRAGALLRRLAAAPSGADGDGWRSQPSRPPRPRRAGRRARGARPPRPRSRPARPLRPPRRWRARSCALSSTETVASRTPCTSRIGSSSRHERDRVADGVALGQLLRAATHQRLTAPPRHST